jgi:hypothetical protein
MQSLTREDLSRWCRDHPDMELSIMGSELLAFLDEIEHCRASTHCTCHDEEKKDEEDDSTRL